MTGITGAGNEHMFAPFRGDGWGLVNLFVFSRAAFSMLFWRKKFIGVKIVFYLKGQFAVKKFLL